MEMKKEDFEKVRSLTDSDCEKISGGAGGVNTPGLKCINWECKGCTRKGTDPFHVGGMHEESCRYRGIVGCKACRHYEKGKTCELFKEN